MICCWGDDRREGLCTVTHDVPNEGHNRIESGSKGEEQQRRDEIVDSGVDMTMYRSIYLL